MSAVGLQGEGEDVDKWQWSFSFKKWERVLETGHVTMNVFNVSELYTYKGLI
jgi:hypothetical protein